MPYKNIVFVKLEKRLLNDHRWYMMSEISQLNYVKLILLAAETYNKIPKNILAIKKAFKADLESQEIEKSIIEIKNNFPKFKENKHFYYFADFNEKTNYRAVRENPGKSQVLPKEGTEKEKDKEKEEDKYSCNPEALQLAELLFSLIKKRDPNHRQPDIKKWAIEIDKLIRLDNRTVKEIEQIIRWVQQDSFWQNNILSARKLREKFGQLVLKFNSKEDKEETIKL